MFATGALSGGSPKWCYQCAGFSRPVVGQHEAGEQERADRMPPLQAFLETLALPFRVRGPLDRSQGRHIWISCRLRRSGFLIAANVSRVARHWLCAFSASVEYGVNRLTTTEEPGVDSNSIRGTREHAPGAHRRTERVTRSRSSSLLRAYTLRSRLISSGLLPILANTRR